MIYHFLTAPKYEHFGKTFTSLDKPCFKSDGVVTALPVEWELSESVHMNSVQDLSHQLTIWEDRLGANCMILGAINDLGRRHIKKHGFMYRRHTNADTQTNHIDEREQHVIFLDIEYEDGNDHLDALARIERFIMLLPREFHDVTYHAQLSANFGIKAGLRVHLFFWARRPLKVANMRYYMRDTMRDLVDYSPINASKSIFITRPRFLDCEDPYPHRSMLVEKYKQYVKLPKRLYQTF